LITKVGEFGFNRLDPATCSLCYLTTVAQHVDDLLDSLIGVLEHGFETRELQLAALGALPKDGVAGPLEMLTGMVIVDNLHRRAQPPPALPVAAHQHRFNGGRNLPVHLGAVTEIDPPQFRAPLDKALR